MRIRAALWTVALALSSALIVVPASADPPVKQPVKDAKAAVKDAKDKVKDAAKDAKEAAGDAKKDAKEAAKDAKKDLKEARVKLHETRKERRQENRKAAREKWGDLVKKPKVREELARHVRFTARLNHTARLAKEGDKEKLADRVEKLQEKENARHDKRMAALKAKGGDE